MSREHILAIDVGTQSTRALLFDPRGTLVAQGRVEIEPYVSPQPGWAEQDPDVYWEAIGVACRDLWGRSPVPPEAVAGVTLTTQRGTVVNVGADGKPLRPAIVWLDQRRTRGVPPVKGPWALALRAAGMADTLAYVQAECEANWISIHEPEIWKRTHRYLLLSGYIGYRLTGRFVDSVGCQVGYLPFDYRRLRWAAPRDWKWLAMPVRPEMLPELVHPGDTLGEITAEASLATGIPAGLPLIAGAADKACEVLGAGCTEPHMAELSFGTTATVNVTTRRYREVERFLPPFPAAVPHAYNMEVQLYRGYWMVRWFKEEFGHLEQAAAREGGMTAEALLDGLAAGVPPGSMGLVLQPFWSPGLRDPGPEAKGAVIGFGEVHTRAHLYRAMLEGLAYGLREGKEKIERRTGTPIRELRVAGGGARSDVALQLTADVFGLPAARPHVAEASGLGAAINGAAGLGLHPDLGAATRAMTRAGRVFEPSPDAVAKYEELYRRVYLPLYRRLQPLYEEIREITGYPPPTG